jgi:tungstate transport system substrate-binding protein
MAMLVVASALALGGCAGSQETAKPSEILLASTTSTRDSGLLETLAPAFEAANPDYRLKMTFVGSGAAIALGGSGDADVLLVHSPAAEKEFVAGRVDGKPATHRGVRRLRVMYNDFVIVGPQDDPAGIEPSDTAQAAFGKIAKTSSVFWSRNDASGTNTKELALWDEIGNPQIGAKWYRASGTMGMTEALKAADSGSPRGYTIADRATWLKESSSLTNLAVVAQGDPELFNQYSVIEVQGARNPQGAARFSAWLRSPEAQRLIGEFGRDRYPDQRLFVPNADQ